VDGPSCRVAWTELKVPTLSIAKGFGIGLLCLKKCGYFSVGALK